VKNPHFILLCFLPLFPNSLQARERTVPFRDVRDFVYQLQNIDLRAVGTSGFDLAVIDYSADGSDDTAFSRQRIDSLRSAPDGPAAVLSYLSIGEAEDYRFYWQSGWKPGNPSWLGHENPDWAGNYRVAYWDPGWRGVVLRYLDRILDAGFDGVYCDLVDQYEYFSERGRTTAAQEMADLVASIRSAGRSRDPGFLVFVQNASELPGLVPGYVELVDGIGQEDVYYGYDRDGVATPEAVSVELEKNLAVFRDAGKTVLTVDYPFSFSGDTPHFDPFTMSKIDRAYGRSIANGFVPYCTVRNLDFMTVNPGHEPASVRGGSGSCRPEDPELLPVYPNPFNASTVIPVLVRFPGNARLSVFDCLGRETARIHLGRISAGRREFRWDGRDRNGHPAGSGVYFAVWESGGRRETVKMLLVR
jgi:cysteinyl-tRNA synthetase, unknown class